jgi:enoyl-CoA hydratase/carnithine racemase
LPSGERIDARTAAAWGLINAAMPADEFIETDQHAAYDHTREVMAMNTLMPMPGGGATARPHPATEAPGLMRTSTVW